MAAKVPTVTDWPLSDGITLTLAEDRKSATIVLDLTQDLGQTGSPGAWGKSIMIAKTVGGAVDVPSMSGHKVQISWYRAPVAGETLKAKLAD